MKIDRSLISAYADMDDGRLFHPVSFPAVMSFLDKIMFWFMDQQVLVGGAGVYLVSCTHSSSSIWQI